MYYVAKFLQASGLAVILVGFLIKFPKLMDPKWIGLGGVIFFCGWILQNYSLKK